MIFFVFPPRITPYYLLKSLPLAPRVFDTGLIYVNVFVCRTKMTVLSDSSSLYKVVCEQGWRWRCPVLCGVTARMGLRSAAERLVRGVMVMLWVETYCEGNTYCRKGIDENVEMAPTSLPERDEIGANLGSMAQWIPSASSQSSFSQSLRGVIVFPRH